MRGTFSDFQGIKKKVHLIESIAGLAVFYTLMVFLISDHYKSDFFQVMIISGVFNFITVAAITLLKRKKAQLV